MNKKPAKTYFLFYSKINKTSNNYSIIMQYDTNINLSLFYYFIYMLLFFLAIFIEVFNL